LKAFEHKKCLFCGSKQVKKNGTRDGKQRYKCTACNKCFSGGSRLDPDILWQLYSEGKQTAAQLAEQHGCSLKTIRRYLAKAVTKAPSVTPQAAVNLIVDTTYFGRKWGVMVLYDAISKRALSVLEVKSETIERYRQEVAALQERGVVIQSIICDGRSGLLQAFPGIPVQMCQFHQIKIIVRYLTKKPKSEAARELRALALTLTGSSKDRFIENLHDWLMRHEAFLNERSVNAETGRSHYTHKKLRSAYHSLKRHLPWLFTFEDFPALSIPNTTNLLEGKFGDMKRLLKCHHGLKKANEILFINDYFLKE